MHLKSASPREVPLHGARRNSEKVGGDSGFDEVLGFSGIWAAEELRVIILSVEF